jgi:hypothetical protein
MRPVILVIEENDSVRDAVCRWATCMFPEGKLLAAKSGKEAIRCTGINSPTVALLDVNLCDMPAGVTKQFIEAMSPATEVVLFSPEDVAAPSRENYGWQSEQREPAMELYNPSIEGVYLN